MNKSLETLGIMAALSYIVIILVVWIDAERRGYTYFRGGEPDAVIRYTEWALGLIAIFVLVSMLKKMLDG